MNTKPSVLLIDANHEPSPDDLKYYIDWLEPFFKVNTSHVTGLESIDVAEDCIVVTGSKLQVTVDPIPKALSKIYKETTKPLLAICWGHHALAAAWGAKVIKQSFLISKKEETINEDVNNILFDELGMFFTAYESHFEHVVKNAKLTRNFHVIAHSNSCKVEGIWHKKRPLFGLQFHPERSPSGRTGYRIARNFAKLVGKR